MAEFQEAFSSALLKTDASTPAGLRAPQGGPAERRFAVYRNNVAHSLVNALADIFPSVQSLVGEEYFRAMARIFIEENPPRSPRLFEYGHGFADFIAHFKPAGNLPYLPEVARLDRLWLDVYHEADAVPLDGSALGAIAPEALGELRFTPHPAARFFASPFSAVTLVSRSRQKASLQGFNPMQAEFGLITRPEFDPQIFLLPEAGFALAESLYGNRSLAEAATIAAEKDAAFDLSQILAILISAGAFTSFSIEGGTR